MNTNEYAKMSQFEKDYWWHRGRLNLLDVLIKKYAPKKENYTILEVGCGTGENTSYLSKYGNVTGIDISAEAISFCEKRGLKDIYLTDILNASPDQPYYKKSGYDVILALDVLEHIQDDVRAMQKIHELLSDDGIFIATVPAHKFLWSEHDEALHHKRRYHSLEIKKKLADAGFKVIKKSYFIFTFFPIIVLYRLWGNIFGKSAYPKTSYVILPKFLNSLLYKLLKFESLLIDKIDLPAGVTIITVARKNL